MTIDHPPYEPLRVFPMPKMPPGIFFPSIREALLSCNGCGLPLQEGEHMLCLKCEAWLAFEDIYGVGVDWPNRVVEAGHG